MPIQVTNDYADVHAFENLWLAYRKAAKGKRGRAAAALFEFKLADNLLQLQEELIDGSYRPGPYTHFEIHEPKRRLISAAPFRDRVIHHALCNVIEPAFERSFIDHSYANRKGKGTHRAINACQRWLKQYPYVLQCDLRQFFPSIDHTILRRVLNRQIQAGQTRELIAQILCSGEGVLTNEYDTVYFPGDDLIAGMRPRGLPIGNLTSQFWANCYMNPFDQFVNLELGCTAYLRYVDDFALFAHDKKSLWGWKEAIVERLAQMRLTVHAGSAQVEKSAAGMRFLGFVVYPQYRHLLRRKGINYQRRLKRLLDLYKAGQIERAEVQHSIRGWINHARYADSWGLRRTILESVRL